MASIVAGYNYDIFISYRQKDNKGDRWVSEFVDALKDELESTFKEEISVYFDINPHDGLLETHDVDASLKEKLKCLVLIPVISRTYCDPNSFAWEHEFKAFVEQASKDQSGLKVKLPNGNIASRVLPVRIHDLDNEDIKLCESILGGVLRGIEFIYKEPGVNKPLTANDNENKNLNNTNYRIQINKTANAIKDIISGLKTELLAAEKEMTQVREPSEQVSVEEQRSEQVKPFKLSKRKLLSGIAVIAILIIAAIFAYPKIFIRDRLNYLRAKDKISLVVMPFRNMTNDTTMNYMREVIQENLVTTLSYFPDVLIVRQTEFVDYLIRSKGFANDASFKPTVASTISKKLDANIFIYGSIGQVGSTIRIDAQLIDSKTGEIYKTINKEVSSKEELDYKIIDALSIQVKDFLIMSLLKKDLYSGIQKFASTDSLNAYIAFIQGQKAYNKSYYLTAVGHYLNALDVDSNFVTAAYMLSLAYSNLGQSQDSKDLCDQARYWCDKVYAKRDQMSEHQKTLTNWLHALIYESPSVRISYLNQLLESDDQLPRLIYNLGMNYSAMSQHEKAISEFKKALEIYKKWGVKPERTTYVTNLGREYHVTRQYKKEKKLYKNAEHDFPDNPALIQRQAILSLTEGEPIEANRYIEKWISIRKENSSSDAEIDAGLGAIYSGAGILDKAENYYTQALNLEPESHTRMNNLAWFLIDNDWDIPKGLNYVEKALELCPDNHFYLDCKGWGLYKQGKLDEALEILNKSWELRPVYRYVVYKHIKEVEYAIASQNNNN
jgi:tetratricopeptide (TPR) repeat protein